MAVVTPAQRHPLVRALHHYTFGHRTRVTVPAELNHAQRRAIEHALGLPPGWCHIGIFDARSTTH